MSGVIGGAIFGGLAGIASKLGGSAWALRVAFVAFVASIAYGFGLQNLGKQPTLLMAAAVMVVLGIACTQLLRPSRPADAAARPDVQP